MLAVYAQGVKKEKVFSVKDFGAKGNGRTLDTKAIQKALDECGKAGGGIVRVPEGDYLIGAIFMKSKTTLHIEEDAILIGSDEEVRDYPIIDSRFNGVEQKSHASVINAIGMHDITITGKGTVSGSGVGGTRPPTGPRVIEFIRCRNVVIEDITVLNKGRWTIHPLYSTNVIGRRLTIRTTGKNCDGFNPDSCNNVLITDCVFHNEEDCIAIKSGKNQQAVDIGIPCENITVTKCTMLAGSAAVAIGSEMSGGIKNVVIKNCVFKNMPRGVDLKTRRGRGGIVENIMVSNIKTINLKGSPLQIRMDYKPNKGTLIEGKAGIPKFRNITFQDFDIKGRKIGKIVGMEESYIENVTVKNIRSNGSKKLELKNIKGLVIENVRNISSRKAVKMKNVEMKK